MFYILNSGVISLSLRSAVDEQMNGNLIWPEDLFSTLVAQSSTLQQHNFAPVATSDLSVCITVLSLSRSIFSISELMLFVSSAGSRLGEEAWPVSFSLEVGDIHRNTIVLSGLNCRKF